MDLAHLNPYIKALSDAIPQLSDFDKKHLATKCRNIVIRLGENPDEASEESESDPPAGTDLDTSEDSKSGTGADDGSNEGPSE